jgi:hypothetical protein
MILTRRKGTDAPPLFDLGGPRGASRHVKAWETTRRALLDADILAPGRDALLLATLRSLAEALDTARAEAEPWLFRALAAEVRATLESHRPTGSGADSLDELLASLAHPAPGDTP